MNAKTVTVVVVLAAVAVLAAVLALRGDRPREAAAGAAPALFAGLESRIDDVELVTVASAAGTSTVERRDGQWRLKEKSGYPVEAGKVRELVLGLAAMTRLEPKTARADLHKSIGVEDVTPSSASDETAPVAPGEPPPDTSRAVRVTLAGKDSALISSVIVGNTRPGSGGSQGVYLRRPGEDQSYLAELGARRFEVPREPLSWVNVQFADIGRDRVRGVTVTPREGGGGEAERIVVGRDAPAGSFAVQNTPEGRGLKNPGISESLGSGLSQASFEDVAEVGTIDFAGAAGGQPGPTISVRTWDGLVVEVQTTEVNGRAWWKLTAAADPDPFKEGEGEGEAAKPRRTPEEVAKEVEELNAKWTGWAYAPYSYKADVFKTKMSEQLAEAAAPAAPALEPLVPPMTPAPPSP
jgi:hypothetical protein